LADNVRSRAATLGFPLATASTPAGTCPALIEVYPHPALIDLLDRDFRIPYKVAKTPRYWPNETLQERIAAIWIPMHADGRDFTTTCSRRA
jgi:predicted RNase H-like nuclease